VLDETAHRLLLAAIDSAITKSIDAYNLASEGGDEELAALVHERLADLQALRAVAAARPTRRSRWQFARSPRGDARSR